VPNLDSSDPCANLSSQFLPRNVTRKADILTMDDYALVGVAPWMSDHSECALAYMQASQADPTRGLIFFPTSLNAAIGTPVWDTPDWGVNASTWNEWVLGTDYPIWAITSDMGATLVREMGKYSGNVTAAPFGTQLAQEFPAGNAVRLFSRISLTNSNDTNPVLGKLWVFAILILAILCVVTAVTSLVLHVNQRRMRHDLRRRIANGVVDLEILGIKRQRVPRKLLDKMPLYIYTSKAAPRASSKEKHAPDSPQTFTSTQRKNLPERDVPFSQPTCPICLDDFEHNQTIVRELPCQHIFHPECVDDFLRTNTSLCPMCKKSALPPGYCPDDITYSVVRRERAIRRMREHGTDSPPLSAILPASIQRFLPAWFLRIRPRPRQTTEQPDRRGNVGPRTSPSPSSMALPRTPPATSPDLEMGISEPTESHHQSLDEMPPGVQALPPEDRREWGRQRLAATLPPAQATGEEEAPPSRMGRFQRAWKKMFPS
jgi:Ring finger domain